MKDAIKAAHGDPCRVMTPARMQVLWQCVLFVVVLALTLGEAHRLWQQPCKW